MSEKKIQISIGMTGINDNYQVNFLKRIEFVINYTFYNLEKLDLLESYTINFVDWASSKPINECLKLYSSKYRERINFHYIDKKITESIKPKNYFNDLFIEKAMNVHLGTAEADFCMATPSDCFFNRSSLLNLYNLLSNKYLYNTKLQKAYFLCPRIVINKDFLNRNPTYEQIDRYLERLNIYPGVYHPSKNYIGSGFGAQLASRNLWREIGGNDETLPPNSPNDEEIFFRISNYYPTFNLGSHGIFNLKLENTKGSRFKKIKTFSRNPIMKLNNISKNENLGSIQGIRVKKVENIETKKNLQETLYFNDHTFIKSINKKYSIKEKLDFCMKSYNFEEKYEDFTTTLYIIKLLKKLDVFYFISFGFSSNLRSSLISQLFNGVDCYLINFLENNSKDLYNTHGGLGRFLSDKKKNYIRFINTNLKNFDQNIIFKDMPSRNFSKIIFVNDKDFNLKLDNNNDDIAIIIFNKNNLIPKNIDKNFIKELNLRSITVYKNKNLYCEIKYSPDDYKLFGDYYFFKFFSYLIQIYRRFKNFIKKKTLFIYSK